MQGIRNTTERLSLMATKRTIIIVCALLVFSAGGISYHKRESIKTRINTWRANSLLADSIKAGVNDDWKEAERLVTAAWQLRPSEIEILRQRFTVSKKRSSKDMLSLANGVFQHPNATAEDRKNATALFFSIGDRITFNRLLSRLKYSERKQPDILEMESRFLLATGQPAAALEPIRELEGIRAEPTDQFLLAAALARTPSEDHSNQIAAQEVIDQIFQPDKDPLLAIAAFSLLGQIPSDQWQLETFSDATSRLEVIAKTVPVPPQILLIDVERRIESFPEKRDELIEDAVSRFIDESPEILGQWLLYKGQADRVLAEVATEAKAADSSLLFDLRLSALLQKKDWTSAEALLANSSRGANEASYLAYRALIAEQQGKVAEADNLWEESFDIAVGSDGRDRLLSIAQLAGSNNLKIRNRAVTEALKRPAAISPPSTEVSFVLPYLIKEDAFEDMLTVCRNLYRSEPDNPALFNNFAWMELINGSPHGAALIPKLRQIVERFSNKKGYRSTLTLAYLNEGDVEKATGASHALVESEEKLNGDYAVLALLRAKQDDIPGAEAYLKQVDWKDMMTRERLYFRRLLKDEGVYGVPLTLER